MRGIQSAMAIVLLVARLQPACAQPGIELPVVGTGFFVSGSGYVMTNNHVIGNCRNVQIRTANGAVYASTVAATDSTNDLALLSSSAMPEKIASF